MIEDLNLQLTELKQLQIAFADYAYQRVIDESWPSGEGSKDKNKVDSPSNGSGDIKSQAVDLASMGLAAFISKRLHLKLAQSVC